MNQSQKPRFNSQVAKTRKDFTLGFISRKDKSDISLDHRRFQTTLMNNFPHTGNNFYLIKDEDVEYYQRIITQCWNAIGDFVILIDFNDTIISTRLNPTTNYTFEFNVVNGKLSSSLDGTDYRPLRGDPFKIPPYQLLIFIISQKVWSQISIKGLLYQQDSLLWDHIDDPIYKRFSSDHESIEKSYYDTLSKTTIINLPERLEFKKNYFIWSFGNQFEEFTDSITKRYLTTKRAQ